jgi:hypothetical protein
MNLGSGPGDLKDAGDVVPALATEAASSQSPRCGKGERRKMTLMQYAKSLFGWGPSDGEKDFRKGEFSDAAAKARDAFLAHKKQHPHVKTPEEMTPLQRRMQSGSI